ncbi:MAG: DUF429 domain-containing protein [Candidatus Eisenbacteria bacterium]
MRVIGLDLAGPGNTADTALVEGEVVGGRLVVRGARRGLDDASIVAAVATAAQAGRVAAGLDAPLSYQMGGGDRPGDRALRALAVRAGLAPGSVMTPTMTRMAYLTLRGISLSRALAALPEPPRVAEVHPGAALALRGAPIADVRDLKRSAPARARLLAWLERAGVDGAAALPADSDHLVAACAAALAAWRWSAGEPAWCLRADPPAHPHDYVA